MRYVAVQLYAAHNSDAGRMGYFLVQVVLFRRKPYVIISVVALGSYKVICVEELHGYSDQGRYCIACICSSNFYFFCNSGFGHFGTSCTKSGFISIKKFLLPCSKKTFSYHFLLCRKSWDFRDFSHPTRIS